MSFAVVSFDCHLDYRFSIAAILHFSQIKNVEQETNVDILTRRVS